MKLIIAFCLVAVAVAAPANKYSPHNVSILRYDNVNNIGSGLYSFAFEQSDGTKAAQSGQLKNEGREDQSLAVTGSYSWIGPDGVTYIVTYTADENGYKPEIEQGPGGAVPNHIATLLG